MHAWRLQWQLAGESTVCVHTQPLHIYAYSLTVFTPIVPWIYVYYVYAIIPYVCSISQYSTVHLSPWQPIPIGWSSHHPAAGAAGSRLVQTLLWRSQPKAPAGRCPPTTGPVPWRPGTAAVMDCGLHREADGSSAPWGEGGVRGDTAERLDG